MIELISSKNIESDRISNLLEIFNEYWTLFQDKWNEDNW